MPSIDQMKPSKFLKKEHVGRAGKSFTIANVAEHNVAQEDKPKEIKWCLEFKEVETPMVLNSANLELTALALNSKNSDDWIGKQVVIYEDPTISFGGKLVGGLRVKVPAA